jgi:hypothetical protein
MRKAGTATASAGGTGRRRKAETIAPDHHAHGYLAMSPLMLLGMTLVCAVAYFVFSQLQIGATEQAVLNIMQSGEIITPGLTGRQIADFMAGRMDRYQTIADGIGWSVQIALTLIAFPANSLLLSLHRRFNSDPGASLTESATNYFKWRRFCTWVLVGGDVLTDFLYVIQDHVAINWSNIIPDVTITSPGVLVIGIIYPVAICFITIFVGKYMFIFLEGLIDELRRGATA